MKHICNCGNEHDDGDFEARTITTAEEARQYAIDWQSWTSEKQNLSYSELAEWQAIFSELAKKYNLKEEFKENGII